MRKHLTPEDLGDLLARPLVAVLATYRRDGSVLLSPVWHEWRDGGFTVASQSGDIKVKHLRRDPRANIVVYEHEPPYSGAELRCTVRLLSDGVHETLVRIATRYLGEEGARAYAEQGADDLLIRLEPGTFRGWDFGV
jgi:PPOX class probable F420-dependent enzyme